MGLLGLWRNLVGIGAQGVQVVVVLDRREFCCGETITGSVEVQAEQNELRVSEVRACVQQEWETSSSEGSVGGMLKSEKPLVLARHVTLIPGVVQRFAFELPAPYGAVKHDWSVTGLVEVHNAGRTSSKMAIALLPPAPLEGLARAVEQVAEWESQVRSNHPKSAATQARYDFEPPKSGGRRLEGVTLTVQLRGSQVVGTLNIKLRTASQNKVVDHPFVFDAAELSAWRCIPSGQISPDVSAQFRAWLAPYLS